jgi:hypothetical protein
MTEKWLEGSQYALRAILGSSPRMTTEYSRMTAEYSRMTTEYSRMTTEYSRMTAGHVAQP